MLAFSFVVMKSGHVIYLVYFQLCALSKFCTCVTFCFGSFFSVHYFKSKQINTHFTHSPLFLIFICVEVHLSEKKEFLWKTYIYILCHTRKKNLNLEKWITRKKWIYGNTPHKKEKRGKKWNGGRQIFVYLLRSIKRKW